MDAVEFALILCFGIAYSTPIWLVLAGLIWLEWNKCNNS